jgi:hypothetical protein
MLDRFGALKRAPALAGHQFKEKQLWCKMHRVSAYKALSHDARW